MRKAFIPISLSNPFYTKDSLRYLFKVYLKEYSSTLIVPCDTLRYLAYEGKEELHPKRLVEQQVLDLTRLIQNTYRDTLADGIDISYEIRLFSEIEKNMAYQNFVFKLNDSIRKDIDVLSKFEEYKNYWCNRIYGQATEKLLSIQNKYILDETALAIYCAEILGYNDEFYAKGRWIFANWIYNSRIDVIEGILDHREPCRRFFEILPETPFK
ncbi:MAG: tRNA-dependent cyclodipeptide synthase [Minwuia sp.]|nr:tRNA-dependent cyclodipeptide synthase [Minwuia sp.]